MTEHAVVIAGGGPTGLMLAGELALAGVDVAIVERRTNQDLAGSRAGALGLHARTIEVFDMRGIADRVLSQGQTAQVVGFHMSRLDIGDSPTRHPYGLALLQNHIERILAKWVDELRVPIFRGRAVMGFTQDEQGVDCLRIEFARLPEDGNRYEVIAGELYESPAPRPKHQIVVGQLVRRLGSFVEEHELGIVYPGPTR